MKVLFHYLFICSVCILFAEVLVFNYLTAVINPFGYLAYGLLIVSFLQFTEKRVNTPWYIYYYFGILIGFLTEAFLAKVIFFGWGEDTIYIFEMIPLESIFLTFFYHPFFSWIIPLVILKKFLRMNTNINFGKYEKPLIALGIVSPFIYVGFNASLSVIPYLALSILVIFIWYLLARKNNTDQDLLLSKKTRRIILIITVIFFTFGYFNLETLNRTEVLLPSNNILVMAVIFSIAIFSVSLHKLKGQKLKQTWESTLSKEYKKTLFYSLIWITILSIFILFGVGIHFQIAFAIYYLLATVAGVIIFLVSIKQYLST